ncbi:MAG TPA: RNA polymerase sigma factor [Candidatus Paenibacillus intestinavium]|nr:RNA polymerase sigma factor [Candidatus Paenibacillus intestinavium]
MDIEELKDLIKLHGKTIYGFCYKLAGNKADTDDLYQDTFLKAMEIRHKMDPNQNPKAFLISIALKLSRNKRRKFAWRQRIAPITELNEAVNETFLPKGEATLEDIVLSHELRSTLVAAAATLDDKFKIPLYMYYTVEMSIDEIASALHIPAGTVKSRLYKARKAMKGILEVEFHE